MAKKRKLTATAKDFEQWLLERGACHRSIRYAEGGKTFSQAWMDTKVFNLLEDRDEAARWLYEDGAIDNDLKGKIIRASGQRQVELLDPDTIGFYDE